LIEVCLSYLNKSGVLYLKETDNKYKHDYNLYTKLIKHFFL